jgi:hypothetical protein
MMVVTSLVVVIRIELAMSAFCLEILSVSEKL